MAMNYQNFASLGVNLNRQKYGPLDISNVFTSLADLNYYLTKGAVTEGVSEYWYKNANEKIVPYPYEGQVLATVIDGVVSVFALSLDAEGNFQTQEIGAKVEVDGTTIVKDANGKLSIVAPVNPDSAKTYNFSYANGVYSWVEVDTATAAGQAQAIAGLTDRATALENIVGKPAEGDAEATGLVKSIADEATARADADSILEGKITAALAEAKKYADDNDADTIYDDTALSNRVKAIEDDYLKADDKYDDSELADKVETLEELVGDADAGLIHDVAANTTAIFNMDAAYKAADDVVLTNAKNYTNDEISGLTVGIEDKAGVEYIVLKNKRGTEIACVNASKFVQDSFLNDVAYDSATGKITFTWIMGDGSNKTDEIDVADLVDTYTAGNGLKVENNEFSIDTEVVATVAALDEVRTLADAAQTAQEVADVIDAKIAAENLSQYAKAADVYTKNDADTKFVADADLGGKIDALVAAINDPKTNTTQVAKDLESLVHQVWDSRYDISANASNITNAITEAKGYTDTEISTLSNSVDTKLNNKADLSIVYTKSEMDAKIGIPGTPEVKDAEGNVTTEAVLGTGIFASTYSKAELNALLDEIEGGSTESAASVARQLDEYKASNNQEIADLKTKNSNQDTEITKAQTTAASGVSKAEAAQTTANEAKTLITTLESNKVNVNTQAIAGIESRISGEGGLSARIGALENDNTNHKTEFAGLNTKVSKVIEETIPALTNRVGTNESDIGVLKTTVETHTTDIAKKANSADVYTKTEVYTKGEVDSKVQEAIEVIPEVDFTPYAKVADVNAALDLKANAADVYTKTDADAKFMTQDQVDARLNHLIDAANDADTITKVSDLVQYVHDNADDIAELITATNKNTDKLAGIDSTVVDTIDAKIAAIPAYELKAATTETLGGIKSVASTVDNGVSVDANGVASVAKVNVNTLVQTEGDTLILNGGKAHI